jgi:hypothetical protein
VLIKQDVRSAPKSGVKAGIGIRRFGPTTDTSRASNWLWHWTL